MSDKPVVCIGAPCYGQVSPEVLEDWMRFAFHCGRRVPQFDFFLAIKSKSEQFRARNAIVEAAQQVGADWLLMLDDDMVINPYVTQGPTDAYGLVERLVGHDKDICGVLYYQRGGACKPVLMTGMNGTGYRFMRDDEITHGLQRVDVAGGGCLLVKMSVFSKLQKPFFEPEHEFGTDIQLCRKAHGVGIEVWADTSIELGHQRSERVVITGVNRHRFQLSDVLPGETKQQIVEADTFTRVVADAAEYLGFEGREELSKQVSVSAFLEQRSSFAGTDAEWYRQYPMERVARQIWYQTEVPDKRQMTEFILASVSDQRSLSVLDFGCGIGIPAVALTERGHRVTACDIRGTSTFEFLQWRVKKHGLTMTFYESEGGIPALGEKKYDVVVAMDSIEHVEEWPRLVRELSDHLVEGGVLFANNAVMNDHTHPEHYPFSNEAFVSTCAAAGLFPFNQITYIKRARKESSDAQNPDPQP